MNDTWENKFTKKNVRHGLAFGEPKPHVFITDFSATAWRRAYSKGLFFENEKWIKCIETSPFKVVLLNDTLEVL